MKSEKTIRGMFEYFILFGHRENPKDFERFIRTLNWVLQDDLVNPIK